jgi:hypothetical protein
MAAMGMICPLSIRKDGNCCHIGVGRLHLAAQSSQPRLGGVLRDEKSLLQPDFVKAALGDEG